MFMEIMGKYPPGMEEVMADDIPGETKAVLDLGCGSGSWYVPLTLLSFHGLDLACPGSWRLHEISPIVVLSL